MGMSTALTIDYERNFLFWISTEAGVIESAELDGSHRKIVFGPVTWSHGLTMVITS